MFFNIDVEFCKLKEEVITKENKVEKKQDAQETTIIEKKVEINEVPVARVTFNHGSSQLSDEDVRKIKEVANLFICSRILIMF